MTTSGQSTLRNILRAIHLPAIWGLGRLRYTVKFSLVAAALLVPTLLVSSQQYSAATHQVRFNGGEHLGALYMDPLQQLLDAQQRHWVASVARALGNKDAAAAEAKAETDAAAQLKRLDELDERHKDDDLFALFVPDGAKQVHNRLQDVKADWAKALDASRKAAAADVSAAHAAAMATTSDFVVNSIANYSNLILDPDLDSYWLMDIVIAKGPTMGIDLASATTTAMLGQHGDKADWVFGLTGSLTDATVALGATQTVNLATSINTTKKYGNNAKIAALQAPYDAFKAQVTGTVDLIKNSAIKPLLDVAAPAAPADPTAPPAPAPAPAKVDVGALMASAMGTFDKLRSFYAASLVPLDELCVRRVDNYRADRLRGLIFTILGVILNIYFFVAFYFGIADSVSSLAGATTRMIQGTSERFVASTKDEIAGIVDDYNKINDALTEARELRRRVEDENAQTQANIVDLLTVVSDASDGNLTVRAQTTTGSLGNVADAFNLLMESLEALVGAVARQVGQSEQAVQSIAQLAQKMAQGASNQSKEVLAARRLVDDVSRQIASVSQDAEGASQASRRTAETAGQGAKVVENVIQGMEELRANVQAGAKKMKNLGDRSMEITSIVATISRISEQTNMLAINAAIEAARAGEHGRGFSVVADEVRKLAERATGATKDIEKLVKAISSETAETIKAIEQQTQVVEEESRTVAAAGDSLTNIRSASEQSAALVAGITTVARSQAEQAQKVARTMESVSTIATDTQQGADTTVATISELVRLSSELRKSIGQFRVTGGN